MLSGLRGPLSDDSTEMPPRSEVYRLLKNRRRRYVILYLSRVRSAPVGELVDRVVAAERAHDTGSGDPAHRDAVYASLHQTHVPELVDAGIVVYDEDERSVALTRRGDRLRAYIDAAERTPPRIWARLFLFQSLFWTAVAAAALTGVPVVGELPTSAILLGCIGTFLATSVLYVLDGPAVSRRGVGCPSV